MSGVPRLLILLGKMVLGLSLLVLAGAAMLMWALYQDQPFAPFASLPSPSGDYALIIEVAHPSFPYGSHRVKLILVSAAQPDGGIAARFRLANDGANLHADHIRMRWDDPETARVCLQGAEQAPLQVRVEARTQRIAPVDAPCPVF